jgi:streptogramin lyase
MNPSFLALRRIWHAATMAILLGMSTVMAATVVLHQDFESFPDAATSLADMADANPTGPGFTVTDDNPVEGAGDAGSGVQLVDWTTHDGNRALLVRSGSEVIVNLPEARSGTTATLDFWLLVAKGEGDRNFYVIVRSMGSDTNGEDFLAYRSDRGATAGIFYYDGVGAGQTWVDAGVGHVEETWQHHRMVFDMATLTFDLYIDESMVVEGGEISRSGASVITSIIVRHEGNSADDGYFVIDDLSLSVEGATDLTATFTEGFEDYPARSSLDDDADPAGAWITTEADGTGNGVEIAPAKVQVVDSTVVAPHSGEKCLKIEGGQRAGISLAWGTPPQTDVQITWWARVPASIAGVGTYNYLRMSLYGAEDDRTDQGDSALLGYGARDASTGDETSLTFYTTQWYDTGADYAPDTWEQYRLTTHNDQGLYSIVKNPDGPNPTLVVDRAAYIGAATAWGPTFLAAWSSSNGTGHPPVYLDDIEIKSVESDPEPLPDPYTVTLHHDRFSQTTILTPGLPVGTAAVDPRDNQTILFTLDAGDGAIYRATHTASGRWTVDETPVATGLDRPSGLAVAPDGTLWWTHDYTQAVMRLQAPWDEHTPEVMISSFGDPGVDDDPIDLTFVPSGFSGSLGSPGMLAVADRGSDGNDPNAIYLIDPATLEPDQTGFANYLVAPDAGILGTGNLNGITTLPASGEVLTVSQDGYLGAVDGNGFVRYVWPLTLWADVLGPTPSGAAVAGDPTTGLLWVADDLLDEIWSVDATPFGTPTDQLEVSFPLTNPERPDLGIDLHDPTLAFSADGALLVLTDGSTANGGGRLIILHNEPISPLEPCTISAVLAVESGIQLEWTEAAPGATYRVLRSNVLAPTPSFEDISGALSDRTFIDTTPPEGQAFYLIEAAE